MEQETIRPASGNGSRKNQGNDRGGNDYTSSKRQQGCKLEAQFIYNDLDGKPYMLKKKWRNRIGASSFPSTTWRTANG